MRHLYFDGVARPVGNRIAARLPTWIRVRWVTLMVPVFMCFGLFVLIAVHLFGLHSAWLTLLVPLWQLAVILDCSDGYLARQRKSASPGGAALDATADIIAMTVVGLALYLSLLTVAGSFSGPYHAGTKIAIGTLLILIGITTWTTAPLSTVAKQNVSGASESSATQFEPPFWALVTWGTLTDWALIVLLAGIAVAAQSLVLLYVVVVWLATSGVLMAISRFRRFYLQSS